MNKIIRLWNQNRKLFILGIALLVFLIIIVHVLNDVAKRKNEEKETIKQNKILISQEEEELPTQTKIGGEEIELEKTKENVKEIQDFVDKCNNGDITGAYNMLTDDCKNALFPEEKLFKTGYYDTAFSEKKVVEMDNYITKDKRFTYVVRFYKDSLSTAKVSSMSDYKDYITIDENKEKGKININSFIYSKQINQEKEVNGIKVKIISEEIYLENEKFNIQIENSTDKDILIDTNKKEKSVYVVSESNVTYGSNISEIANTLKKIPSNFYGTYKLQFNKSYISGAKTLGIVFSDIVPDYTKYKEDSSQMTQRVQISVTL